MCQLELKCKEREIYFSCTVALLGSPGSEPGRGNDGFLKKLFVTAVHRAAVHVAGLLRSDILWKPPLCNNDSMPIQSYSLTVGGKLGL